MIIVQLRLGYVPMVKYHCVNILIKKFVISIKMLIKDRFNSRLFICNFFVNVFIAVAFVFVGDSLGLDLYYVVLLALGFRLLQDLDIIKLCLFNK